MVIDMKKKLFVVFIFFALILNLQQIAAFSVSVTITGGCGSTHCIGDYVVTIIELSENAYIDVWVETFAGSWYNKRNEYHSAGRHSFGGTVSSPEGIHTIHVEARSVSGNFAEDTCFFYVSGGGQSPPPTPSSPPSDKDDDGVIDSEDECYNPNCRNIDSSGCPKDSDSDGVNDCEDDCPYEKGPASNNGCEEIGDRDNDGITDDRDSCYNPDCRIIDSSGCPKDSDSDGVNDCEDECLYDQGPASNNGCPVEYSSDILKYWWILPILLIAFGGLVYLNHKRPPKLKM